MLHKILEFFFASCLLNALAYFACIWKKKLWELFEDFLQLITMIILCVAHCMISWFYHSFFDGFRFATKSNVVLKPSLDFCFSISFPCNSPRCGLWVLKSIKTMENVLQTHSKLWWCVCSVHMQSPTNELFITERNFLRQNKHEPQTFACTHINMCMEINNNHDYCTMVWTRLYKLKLKRPQITKKPQERLF